MTYILHLETATKVCSVALSLNGKLVQLKESFDEQYSHGENLTLFIEEVLQLEGIAAKDISAISISSGPGSYTGLRIGVSVAKGLCYSLNIPLIAIDSLTCLFELTKIKYSDATIVPMIDARRMEVFCSVFQNNIQTQEIKAEVLAEDSFEELEPFVVCGDACQKLVPFWTNRNVILETNILSSAKGQVQLAFQKYTNSEFENVAYFEPFYLKDFAMKQKVKE
ncbi:MAG: tRNA (adenosine(37)-N6)-threonylcarbamoyltransferase complex dimerization subunit type 1 TsaB [Flavobacteriia bacterium]|jgi:tRNA threonylcarbamoyladenosine biosynthesis protein TsaB